jgi:polar amino acid transport system substrate-binding protein
MRAGIRFDPVDAVMTAAIHAQSLWDLTEKPCPAQRAGSSSNQQNIATETAQGMGSRTALRTGHRPGRNRGWRGTHLASPSIEASRFLHAPCFRFAEPHRRFKRMRRFLLVVIAALAVSAFTVSRASAAAQKCEPLAAAKKYPSLAGKTIRVAQDGASPPYSFRDPDDFNKLIGLDADLARAAFACIGVPIEFKPGNWSGLLPAVIAGQADLMWDNLYYTPARAQQVDFITFLLAATGGMVRKGNPKHIHGLDDLCGLRTAAGLGTVEEASLRRTSEKCVAAGKSPVEVVTYQDKPSGARMLQNDRTDLMMTDSGVVGQLVALSPNDFERAFTIVTNFKVGPGISKNLPELRQAVYDAMQILQVDGTQKRLMAKYNVDPSLQLPVELFTK